MSMAFPLLRRLRIFAKQTAAKRNSAFPQNSSAPPQKQFRTPAKQSALPQNSPRPRKTKNCRGDAAVPCGYSSS